MFPFQSLMHSTQTHPTLPYEACTEMRCAIGKENSDLREKGRGSHWAAVNFIAGLISEPFVCIETLLMENFCPDAISNH